MSIPVTSSTPVLCRIRSTPNFFLFTEIVFGIYASKLLISLKNQPIEVLTVYEIWSPSKSISDLKSAFRMIEPGFS